MHKRKNINNSLNNDKKYNNNNKNNNKDNKDDDWIKFLKEFKVDPKKQHGYDKCIK